MTLRKSLFERLLSPLTIISFFERTKSPSMSRANVPELPAFKIIFFLYLNPFKPSPFISQNFLFNLIFIPSFFKQFSVSITSSDFKRLKDLDTPEA